MRRRLLSLALSIGLLACVGPRASAGQPAPAATAAAVPAAGGLTLTVSSAPGAPISPLIYGVNQTDLSLKTFGIRVVRWGGNATTRYNWQNDVYNTGSDYFFENITSDNPDNTHLPDGSAADRFVEANRAAGAASIITVPLIGFVSKDSPAEHPFACGFKESVYGPQQSTDPYDADCGNGIAAAGNPNFAAGQPITGNDPADTSVAVGPPFVQAWVAHLAGRYGRAAAGGVRFYALDNEPGIWTGTHRDVFPGYVSYDTLGTRGIQYAQAIKAADPTAQVLGPVQDGWTRYFYSGYRSYPDAEAQADRDAKGLPFIPWYLQQMRAYEQQHGQRLLDYLDVHYYPQAPDVSLSPAGDAATQALRLRSTRALWDPTYVDESWIKDTEDGNTAVQLIPRLRAWRDQYYPGTKLAITEYNWGALDDMNGALAEADVLGIFGREGVDLATLWAPPAPTDPGAFALRMYRNYDGAGSTFGDISLPATSSDQGALAVYAARRGSDGAVTIMVVNKSTSAQTATLSVAGASGAAQVYRYSAANLGAIVHLPDQALGGSVTFPASSITLLVAPGRAAFLPSVVR